MLKPPDTNTERHLTVTPIDLRQMRFGTALRGYDRDEVAAFLLEVADQYEQTLRQNDRLRQDIVRLEAALNQYRELEGSLKTTLMSAQKVADDMRDGASQDAARLVREAEGRADLSVRRAEAQLQDIQREIDGLMLKRRDAETALETTITALRSALEFVREQRHPEGQPLGIRSLVDVTARRA